MINFHEGPAHGKTLLLKRSPIFLRVVIDGNGNIDALDALDDIPADEESIYCYKVDESKPISRVHILTGNPGRKGSGWFISADYNYFDEQPADDQMRSTEAWRKWTKEIWQKR